MKEQSEEDVKKKVRQRKEWRDYFLAQLDKHGMEYEEQEPQVRAYYFYSFCAKMHHFLITSFFFLFLFTGSLYLILPFQFFCSFFPTCPYLSSLQIPFLTLLHCLLFLALSFFPPSFFLLHYSFLSYNSSFSFSLCLSVSLSFSLSLSLSVSLSLSLSLFVSPSLPPSLPTNFSLFFSFVYLPLSRQYYDDKTTFVKVHVRFDALLKGAEDLLLRLPLKSQRSGVCCSASMK